MSRTCPRCNRLEEAMAWARGTLLAEIRNLELEARGELPRAVPFTLGTLRAVAAVLTRESNPKLRPAWRPPSSRGRARPKTRRHAQADLQEDAT